MRHQVRIVCENTRNALHGTFVHDDLSFTATEAHRKAEVEREFDTEHGIVGYTYVVERTT